MKRLAIVVAVFFLGGAACGGGGSPTRTAGSESTASTPAPPPDDPPTRADAEAAVLALADMPPGWTPGAFDDDEDDDEFCEQLEVGDTTEPVAEAESDFQLGQAGPFVIHAVAMYDDEERAEQVMAAARTAFDQCRTFEQTDDDGQPVSGSFTAASFPTVGDETVAAKLRAQGQGFLAGGDVIVFRQGRAISMLLNFGIEASIVGSHQADSALTVSLARRSLEKLQAVG